MGIRISKKQRGQNYITAAGSLRTDDLEVFTFVIEKGQSEASFQPRLKRVQQHVRVSDWIKVRVKEAKRTQANPSIDVLVVETPEDQVPGSSKQRGFYAELLTLIDPALTTLGFDSSILVNHGSVFFKKWDPDILDLEYGTGSTAPTSGYHVALGDFSLAFRYFPQSKTCVGILLVQDYKEVATELLYGLNTHRVLIGESLLMPLLASRAMTKIITAWLNQHEETVNEVQALTGFHHMASASGSSEFRDYVGLSAKISGVAVDIVSVQLCWQALVEHANYMAEDLREGRPFGESETDKAVANFMHSFAVQIARNAQAKLHETASWQQKASILGQIIFNLIAQQDQNITIGIARDSVLLTAESKKDSTSMKVIAIVTMTYLPGTFVAACYPYNVRLPTANLD